MQSSGHFSKGTKHTVRRAIILAAGKGERLRPLTLNVPKPLIKVHGRAMIESAIDALLQNGIQEIHVVTGYKKEAFLPLAVKYPSIDFVDNPMYDTCNNISSLYAAREYLEDAIVMDGDQVIKNPAILCRNFAMSGYFAAWSYGRTDEWTLQTDGGIIKSCAIGGENCYQLFSISRWSCQDGKLLRHHLEKEFAVNSNRQIYWDNIPLFLYAKEYTLGVTKINIDDVAEIDTAEDLKMEDGFYGN